MLVGPDRGAAVGLGVSLHPTRCPHIEADAALDPELQWFCPACRAIQRPPCGLCGCAIQPEQRHGEYEGHRRAWVGGWRRLPAYCADCVARVRRAGPWKERRARAAVARSAELRRVFEGLSETKHTPFVTQLEGDVGGRRCQIRLRRGARQRRGGERYVVHMELRVAEAPGPTALKLASGWPQPATLAVTVDRGCWLRAGFRHLGKLDVVSVVHGLRAEAEHRDGAPVRR